MFVKVEGEFSVFGLDKFQFDGIRPSLSRFQDLIYHIYAEDDEIEVKGDETYKHRKMSVRYLLAKTDDLSGIFKQNVRERLGGVGEELAQYRQIAGFLKIEWGVNNGTAPFDDARLFVWSEWPHGVIGYVGGFTVSPLLPREVKMEVQRDLHKYLYQMSEELGFSEQLFTVLAPNVLEFVIDSGLEAELVEGAKLDSESEKVQELIARFPGYWSNRPQLYRFVPKEL